MIATLCDSATHADTIRNCFSLIERYIRGEIKTERLYRGTVKFKTKKWEPHRAHRKRHL